MKMMDALGVFLGNVDSIGDALNARTSVSVSEFGAVGDGVADDTESIQAALDSSARRIVFPAGKYRITSTLTRDDPGKIELVGLSGAGAEAGSAPVEIWTDSAIEMMVLGNYGAHTWAGPTIRNIGFYGTGSVLCGLRLLQVSSWTLENFYAANLFNGAGLVLDGGPSAMDYGTLINPRIVHCHNGIRADGHVTDITIIGGRLTAERPCSNPGAGILHNGVGRWSIFGTGINNYLYGIDGARLGYGFFRATIEANGSAKHTPGSVGVRILGSDSSAGGDANQIQCEITGYETGVEFGAPTVGNCMLSTTPDCLTQIKDNGRCTQIGVVCEAGSASRNQGIKYGYVDNHNVPNSIKIRNNLESFGKTVPVLQASAGGFLVKDRDGVDGGLYLGTEDANSGAVGAGIFASAAGPAASSTAGSWIRFHDSHIIFYSFVGAAIGASPGPSANTMQARIANKALYLPGRSSAPGAISGFAGIYVDDSDGSLKVRFSDGTIKTLATNQ